MEISLPYGGRLKRFEAKNLAGRFRCHFPQISSREKLKSLIGERLSPYFEKFAGKKVLTVVNDAYRRTPNDQLLPFVWEFIKNGKIIIACGSHRAPTPTELNLIFGQWTKLVRPHLIIHDCYDNASMVDLGKTSAGTPVILNKVVADADIILTINSVEPHFFAGYTGGRKSIVPGLAAFETIRANHYHAKDVNAVALNLDTNPLHQDLMDAIGFLADKSIITLQCVTDRDGEIIDLFAGELNEAFESACVSARKYYAVEVPQKFDIVIANCDAPLDLNLYQLQKAQDHGGMMVRDGGILIVTGACPEGTGSDYFIKSAEKYPRPEDVLGAAESDHSFGMHKLVKTARQLQHFRIYYVTALDKAILAKVYFEGFGEIEEALSRAFDELGQQAEIAILEDAGYTVPVVRPE